MVLCSSTLTRLLVRTSPPGLSTTPTPEPPALAAVLHSFDVHQPAATTAQMRALRLWTRRLREVFEADTVAGNGRLAAPAHRHCPRRGHPGRSRCPRRQGHDRHPALAAHRRARPPDPPRRAADPTAAARTPPARRDPRPPPRPPRHVQTTRPHGPDPEPGKRETAAAPGHRAWAHTGNNPDKDHLHGRRSTPRATRGFGSDAPNRGGLGPGPGPYVQHRRSQLRGQPAVGTPSSLPPSA
jgi:hypothetical protein